MDFDAQGSYFSLATSCVSQSPVLLVWIGALFLAVTRWQQHPRTSLFTLIAVGLEFVALLSSLFLTTWLVPWMYQQEWGMMNIGLALTASTFLHAIISAVAWGLLFYTIFYVRDSAQAALKPVQE
jgi:hypothetical protein